MKRNRKDLPKLTKTIRWSILLLMRRWHLRLSINRRQSRRIILIKSRSMWSLQWMKRARHTTLVITRLQQTSLKIIMLSKLRVRVSLTLNRICEIKRSSILDIIQADQHFSSMTTVARRILKWHFRRMIKDEKGNWQNCKLGHPRLIRINLMSLNRLKITYKLSKKIS